MSLFTWWVGHILVVTVRSFDERDYLSAGVTTRSDLPVVGNPASLDPVFAVAEKWVELK